MRYTPNYDSNFLTKDGRNVHLRLVRPSDKSAFIDGLNKCSDRTIYNRFLGTKPKFSQGELEYLTTCDPEDHVALVGFFDNELVAVARFIRFSHRPNAADFGLIIRDDFQRVGLGKYILSELISAAIELKLVYLCGEMFATNSAMFNLVDCLPFTTDWLLDGSIAQFEVDLTSEKWGDI